MFILSLVLIFSLVLSFAYFAFLAQIRYVAKDSFFTKQGNLKFYGKYDKLEHAFFYVPIVFSIFFFFNYLIYSSTFTTSFGYAIIYTEILGLLKELFDGSKLATSNKLPSLFRGNGFSKLDFYANNIGLISCFFLYLGIFHQLIFIWFFIVYTSLVLILFILKSRNK